MKRVNIVEFSFAACTGKSKITIKIKISETSKSFDKFQLTNTYFQSEGNLLNADMHQMISPNPQKSPNWALTKSKNGE